MSKPPRSARPPPAARRPALGPRTLAPSHPATAPLPETHVPQNEGQHLQSVYPPTNQLRGVFQYAFRKAARITDSSKLVTAENRRALLDAWSPFWRMTASRLVEKSPRHSTMTRFLQAIFAPAPSLFVATIRHPLACGHYHWGKLLKKGKVERMRSDCGEMYIAHWLRVYDVLLEDMKYLDKVRMVHFELFMGEGFQPPLPVDKGERLTQEMVDALFRMLGVPENVRLSFIERSAPPRSDDDDDNDDDDGGDHDDDDRDDRGGNDDDDGGGGDDDDDDDDSSGGGSERRQRRPRRDTATAAEADSRGPLRTGRHLLKYHGDWHDLRLQRGTTQAWADDWLANVDMASDTCKKMVDKYEARVNALGYSLRDLRHVWLPKAIEPYYLHVPELLVAYSKVAPGH